MVIMHQKNLSNREKELSLIFTHIFNTVGFKGIYSYICDVVYAGGLEERRVELLMCKMEVKDCRVAFGIQRRLASMNNVTTVKCFPLPQKFLQVKSQDEKKLHFSPPNIG